MRHFFYCLYCAVAIAFIANSARLSAAFNPFKFLWGAERSKEAMRQKLQLQLNDKLKPGLKKKEFWDDFVNYAKRSLGIKRVVFLHPIVGHREHILRIVDMHDKKIWKIWEGLERKQSRDVEEVINQFCGSQRKRTLVIGTSANELRMIYQRGHYCVVALSHKEFNFELRKSP